MQIYSKAQWVHFIVVFKQHEPWPKALSGANLNESPAFSSEIVNISMDEEKTKTSRH